jgi:uncharacterized protein (DUF362 family)
MADQHLFPNTVKHKIMNRRRFIYRTSGFIAGSALLNSFPLKVLADAETPDIALVKSSDYYKSTQKAIQEMGGIRKFITPGSSVGFLLNSDFTERGTYSHPDIALAAMYLCWEAGAKEIVFLQPVKEEYWRRSTRYSSHRFLVESSKEVGSNVFPAEYNLEDFIILDSVDKGIYLKNIEIVRKIREVDVFINIPILKHHGSTIVTGALKNMMGLTTRKTNVTFHLGSGKRNDPEYLAQCIAELNLIRKPDLVLADATEFITANGPEGPGPLKKLDIVVAGTDPVAIDALGATYLDMLPADILTVQKAYDLGIGEMDLSRLNILEMQA